MAREGHAGEVSDCISEKRDSGHISYAWQERGMQGRLATAYLREEIVVIYHMHGQRGSGEVSDCISGKS